MDNATKLIFYRDIWPVMFKYHREHPNATSDAYFSAVIYDLKKKNISLNNDLVNMILDQMAADAKPKNAFGYIKNKVLDGNIVKTVFDWTHSNLKDTPLDTEIKRRAELMYNAGTASKTVASLATATTDIAATAPIALLCPQSVVYGYLTQGGYDVINNKWLLPEKKEERDNAAKTAIDSYNAKEEAANWKKIPGWMLSVRGIKDYKKATDKQLTDARDWAKRNAKFWHDEYDKLSKGKFDLATNVNGKTFSKHECLVKYDQYDLFRAECQKELTARYKAQQQAEKKQQKESKSQDNILDDVTNTVNDTVNDVKETVTDAASKGKDAISDALSSFGNDPWGQLLNDLGFNGLGNVGKHLGITLASLPDMIFGAFTGSTKSLGMNKETLIPLASLAAGHFVSNPLLKAALMGYGGLKLINKVGNEAIARQEGKAKTNANSYTPANVTYKQYSDEQLNSRIANLHIEGNQLLADIDKVPCAITLPDATVQAYKSGALPLNTLANAVLAKSDLMSQQSEQASQTYNNMQKQEQSRGIR